MKRIVICLMLLALMLTGMMSVHAAEAEISVEVRPSKTEVQVGDTVEYTVLATGSGVVAMQFNLQLPEGLAYVPNSAATPENLAQKLGVPAADWTEKAMMFTFYNDVGITFAEGTEILHFTCVAEKEGTWQVDLYELLPFDGEFLEFTPKLQVQTVQVTGSDSQNTGSFGGAADEIQPPDVPDDTTTDVPVDEMQPVVDSDSVQEDAVISVPEQGSDSTQENATDLTETPSTELTPAKNNQIWIVPVGILVLIALGVVIFFQIKKKNV